VHGEIDPGLVQPTLCPRSNRNEWLSAAWKGYHLIDAAMRLEQIRPEYRLLQGPRKRAHRRGAGSLCRGQGYAGAGPYLQLFNLGPDAELPPRRHAGASWPEPFRLADPAQRWHVDEPGPGEQAGPISRDSPETIAGISYMQRVASTEALN